MKTKLLRLRALAANNLLRLGVAVGSVTAGVAHAAADAAFTAAATEAKTNIALYGAELILIAAVGVGFWIAIKYVKSIRRVA